MLNGVLWNRQITRRKDKQIRSTVYNSTMTTINLYRWKGDAEDQKNGNNVIRGKINIKISVLKYIAYKRLNWYGHVGRMNEEGYLMKFWNVVHLEEKEDLEILGSRKEQLE